MGWIAPLMFLYEDAFGIVLPMKDDIPLNKETKPKNKDLLF